MRELRMSPRRAILMSWQLPFMGLCPVQASSTCHRSGFVQDFQQHHSTMSCGHGFGALAPKGKQMGRKTGRIAWRNTSSSPAQHFRPRRRAVKIFGT